MQSSATTRLPPVPALPMRRAASQPSAQPPALPVNGILKRSSANAPSSTAAPNTNNNGSLTARCGGRSSLLYVYYDQLVRSPLEDANARLAAVNGFFAALNDPLAVAALLASDTNTAAAAGASSSSRPHSPSPPPSSSGFGPMVASSSTTDRHHHSHNAAAVNDVMMSKYSVWMPIAIACSIDGWSMVRKKAAAETAVALATHITLHQNMVAKAADEQTPPIATLAVEDEELLVVPEEDTNHNDHRESHRHVDPMVSVAAVGDGAAATAGGGATSRSCSIPTATYRRTETSPAPAEQQQRAPSSSSGPRVRIVVNGTAKAGSSKTTTPTSATGTRMVRSSSSTNTMQRTNSSTAHVRGGSTPRPSSGGTNSSSKQLVLSPTTVMARPVGKGVASPKKDGAASSSAARFARSSSGAGNTSKGNTMGGSTNVSKSLFSSSATKRSSSSAIPSAAAFRRSASATVGPNSGSASRTSVGGTPTKQQQQKAVGAVVTAPLGTPTVTSVSASASTTTVPRKLISTTSSSKAPSPAPAAPPASEPQQRPQQPLSSSSSSSSAASIIPQLFPIHDLLARYAENKAKWYVQEGLLLLIDKCLQQGSIRALLSQHYDATAWHLLQGIALKLVAHAQLPVRSLACKVSAALVAVQSVAPPPSPVGMGGTANSSPSSPPAVSRLDELQQLLLHVAVKQIQEGLAASQPPAGTTTSAGATAANCSGGGATAASQAQALAAIEGGLSLLLALDRNWARARLKQFTVLISELAYHPAASIRFEVADLLSRLSLQDLEATWQSRLLSVVMSPRSPITKGCAPSWPSKETFLIALVTSLKRMGVSAAGGGGAADDGVSLEDATSARAVLLSLTAALQTSPEFEVQRIGGQAIPLLAQIWLQKGTIKARRSHAINTHANGAAHHMRSSSRGHGLPSRPTSTLLAPPSAAITAAGGGGSASNSFAIERPPSSFFLSPNMTTADDDFDDVCYLRTNKKVARWMCWFAVIRRALAVHGEQLAQQQKAGAAAAANGPRAHCAGTGGGGVEETASSLLATTTTTPTANNNNNNNNGTTTPERSGRTSVAFALDSMSLREPHDEDEEDNANQHTGGSNGGVLLGRGGSHATLRALCGHTPTSGGGGGNNHNTRSPSRHQSIAAIASAMHYFSHAVTAVELAESKAWVEAIVDSGTTMAADDGPTANGALSCWERVVLSSYDLGMDLVDSGGPAAAAEDGASTVAAADVSADATADNPLRIIASPASPVSLISGLSLSDSSNTPIHGPSSSRGRTQRLLAPAGATDWLSAMAEDADMAKHAPAYAARFITVDPQLLESVVTDAWLPTVRSPKTHPHVACLLLDSVRIAFTRGVSIVSRCPHPFLFLTHSSYQPPVIEEGGTAGYDGTAWIEGFVGTTHLAADGYYATTTAEAVPQPHHPHANNANASGSINTAAGSLLFAYSYGAGGGGVGGAIVGGGSPSLTPERRRSVAALFAAAPLALSKATHSLTFEAISDLFMNKGSEPAVLHHAELLLATMERSLPDPTMVVGLALRRLRYLFPNYRDTMTAASEKSKKRVGIAETAKKEESDWDASSSDSDFDSPPAKKKATAAACDDFDASDDDDDWDKESSCDDEEACGGGENSMLVAGISAADEISRVRRFIKLLDATAALVAATALRNGCSGHAGAHHHNHNSNSTTTIAAAPSSGPSVDSSVKESSGGDGGNNGSDTVVQLVTAFPAAAIGASPFSSSALSPVDVADMAFIRSHDDTPPHSG